MEYIFPGLVIGAVYAILGNSITLTYSATGVLNLATGTIAYVIADLYYHLVAVENWTLLSAGLLSIVVVSPALGFVLWLTVFRQMEKSDLVVQVVATIGLAVALPAIMQVVIPNAQVQQAPGIIPGGLYIVHLGFITATRNQLAAVIGALVCVIGLVLLVDRTRLGLATRAVVDRPLLAQSRGINTARVGAVSWVLAGLLAGIGGVLLSPLITLDSGTYTELTVAALSVALFGRFRGLIVTALAGLGLGVASSLITGYAPAGNTVIGGLVPSLPFFLLTILLLSGASPLSARQDAVQAPPTRRRSLARVAAASRSAPVTDVSGELAASGDGGQVAGLSARRSRYLSPFTLLTAVACIGLLLVAMFAFSDYWTGILASGLAFAVIFLSLTVATGEGGVLCLGQASFTAVGGFVAGRLASTHGMSIVLAALIGVVAAMAVGFIIGAIGSRLDQIGFALVTLAFALFCERFAFNITLFVPTSGVPFKSAHFFGMSVARSEVLLGAVVFAVVAGLVVYAKRGRFGRAYAAIRANPLSSEGLGINVRLMRTIIFAIGGGIAGLGGVLLGIDEQQLGIPDVALAVGLVWVAVVVTFGVRGTRGALLAGLAFALIPAAFSLISVSWIANVPTILFGLGAVGLAKEPRGFLAQLDDGWNLVISKWRSRTSATGGRGSDGVGAPQPAGLEMAGER
jgi:branched-chain amino acid transport system permease protein